MSFSQKTLTMFVGVVVLRYQPTQHDVDNEVPQLTQT